MVKTIQQQKKKIHQEWPTDKKEYLHQCPICGSDRRTLMYEGLQDGIFEAPGYWNLYNCQNCGSAYLDPRPTPATIHMAYETYYTHKPAAEYSSMPMRERMRRALGNGYRNWRYGTNDKPSTSLGVIAALLMPNARSILDAGMRYLPRAHSNQRLLDIGFGNGEFLLRVQNAGWDVVGIDPDPKVVDAALELGLDARLAGIEDLDDSKETFDAITMAHVIEHVHDPLTVLKTCFHILNAGGSLWIETPNIEAQGHKKYGRAWRGLEPPRHLSIFTHDSLVNLLKQAGFTKIEFLPYRRLTSSLFAASSALRDGLNPYSGDAKDERSRHQRRQDERNAKDNIRQREFIEVRAWK